MNNIADPDFIPDPPVDEDFLPDPEFKDKYRFSKIESAGMGLAQAATMEHADEAYSAATGEPLDKVRDNFKEAASQNPGSYYGTKTAADIAIGTAGTVIAGPAAPAAQVAAQMAGSDEGGPISKTISAAEGALMAPMANEIIEDTARVVGSKVKPIIKNAADISGINKLIDNANRYYKKGLDGMKVYGNEMSTEIAKKARAIPGQMQEMLMNLKENASLILKHELRQMDEQVGAIDLAPDAQEFLGQLDKLQASNPRQKASIDLAKQEIMGSIFGAPKKKTYSKIPYEVEKTVDKVTSHIVPQKTSMQFPEVDQITGAPIQFETQKINVPGSSYVVPGREAVNIPGSSYNVPGYESTSYDIMGVPSKSSASSTRINTPGYEIPGQSATKISTPGYNSEFKTDIPIVKNVSDSSRSYQTISPEIQKQTGFYYVPSQDHSIYSQDPITGTQSSNVLKTPSQIQKMKTSAARTLNYNKQQDPDFSLDHMPEARIILDQWRNRLREKLHVNEAIAMADSAYGGAANALDDLPRMNDILNSDKVFTNIEKKNTVDGFFENVREATPENYQETVDALSPTLENYEMSRSVDPDIGKKIPSFINRSANAVGLAAGKIPRTTEAIKNFFPVIEMQLSKMAPEKAQEFRQAYYSGDDALMASIAGTFAPLYSDVLDRAPQGTKGQYSSYFDGKLHNPVDKQQYIIDVKNNQDLSNTDKAKRINEMNKTGKIIP